ncbi:MAG: 5'/3'-nucleotidase SurE [Clostridiales bacterium]|nr:5'/3'-nucleotidase SurE [Clostridiales bacterium]HBM81984.1 5'/3'-nucleotidase SurE [Clostridiaceae bacterium]
MNILITNDDGINSEGIYALAKEFIKEGSIIVSAPDRQRSACSHSITMGRPLFAKRKSFFDLDCSAYAISGTPVDCVKLAYERFSDGKIDAVISGINDGENLGTDVLYSGTVSAAIEGALLGIPSIAVSLLRGDCKRDYSAAAHCARGIFKKFISQKFNPDILLNVNVPSCDEKNIKGFLATTLGTMKYTNNYQEEKDADGNTYFLLAGEVVKVENGRSTDIFAAQNNYVSITPMHFELTRFDYLQKIKEWDMHF